MAYEHGSLDLGIRNPFKLEGAVRTVRGLIVALLGLILLLQVAQAVQHNPVTGWVIAVAGFILLANGLWACGSGIMQVLRFFVGRSVPTSLAFNNAKSESDSAAREQNDVAYNADQIEQMLVGRKNLTFAEPLGLVARLLHTLFPRLTFVPYPIRNLAQRLAGALAQTLLGLTCFALAWFTTSTGLAGQTGPLMLPIFTSLLLLYLVAVWYRAGRPISREVARTVESEGSGKLARTLALAIIAPVGIAWGLQTILNNNASFARRLAEWQGPVEQMRRSALETYTIWQSYAAEYSNALWLGVLIALALISCGLLITLTSLRSREAKPVTEVAELRDNWQESVHPREIFINIDSMVMANRRHKEVPNRVYRALQPHLQEQADGKGSFYGEMIQETQPVALTKTPTSLVKGLRIASTVIGQLLLLAAAITLYLAIEPVTALLMLATEASQSRMNLDTAVALASQLGSLANLAMALMLFAAFGRLLANFAHVFWGEIQFESLLVYFKCEGTFTESRVSTGTGVYDSTQSENTVVRSSMTPWVIVSRVVSSTFAGIGSRNLEYARHILEMRADDAELQGIVGDLRQFLKNRETIASISNEKDLEATSKIYQVNEQTRAAAQSAPAGAPQLAQAQHNQLEHQVD